MSVNPKNFNILDNLNPNQEEAVLYVKGPLRIIAGAGSGKTRILTRKVAYLINILGIDPSKILAVTFTNKAAIEMKQRIKDIIGDDIDKSQISTFHSLVVKILREDIHKINMKNGFRIIDRIDQNQILSSIYKELDLQIRAIPYSNVLDYISLAKLKRFSPQDAYAKLLEIDGNKRKAQIYEMYEKKKQKYSSFDFDDLLLMAEKLLEESISTREKWANRFDYILIDEFQDTSIVQYNIIKLLLKNDNLTIVGDPDQTIYSWRGANVNLILNFNKDFPSAKTIFLSQNYRSTKSILELSNLLISRNKNRLKKDLFSTNAQGEDFQYFHGMTPESESRWVVSKIESLRKNKVQLKDIAIFYRSNYLSKTIEQALIGKGIDYKVFGSIKFYQRTEIKDAIAYLRVLSHFDEQSLLRIINVPSRKLGDKSINKLETAANKNKLSFFANIIKNFNSLPISENQKIELKRLFSLFKKFRLHLKKRPSSKVLKMFMESVGYFQMLKDANADSKLNALDNLFSGIDTYLKKNPNIDAYLKEVELWTIHEDYHKITDFVSLMTIHNAKGLEFNNVFIIGMSDGVFPSSKAILDGKNAIEEERRLAYVAITRAKKRVYFSDSKGYSNDKETMKIPSRFFKDMKIDVKKIAGKYVSTKNYYDNYDKNKNIVIGDKINHIIFGMGEVVGVNGNTINVVFKGSLGIKSLMKNHKSIEVIT